jgi:predicted MFS family arabinose efflux permease
MSRKELTIMMLLAAVVFTNILESMILMPLASTIKAELLMDEKKWGIAISSYLFASFFSGVLAIKWIDRFDRRKFIISQYACFIIGTILCSLATSFEFLVFARIAAGFFGGVSSALVLAITGDLIAPQFRGKATGIVMTGFSTAAALGIPIGLSLGLKFSWHAPFYLIIALSAVVLFLLYKTIPTMRDHIQAKPTSFVQIFKNILAEPNQILAILFSCMILFGQFAIIPFLADFMVYNVGLKKTELIWMYFFGGGLTFVTSPFIGGLSDKYGQKNLFLIIMLLSCIPIFIITGLGTTPLYLVLISTTGFFIFAGGRNIPGTAIVIATAAPHERGGLMSVRGAFQQLFSGFAVMLGSFIVVQDPVTKQYSNFEIIGYLAIFTSILSYFILIKIKPKA